MDVKDIINQITVICRRNNVEHLYLFGSYAKGFNHSTSDIDIAVTGDVIVTLENELKGIATLRKIDLVYLEQTGLNGNLKEDILEHGKILY